MRLIEFLEEHKIWWESFTIFTSWLIIFFCVIPGIVLPFLLLVPPITVFKLSALVMIISLIVTSYLSTKEFLTIFISWGLLAIGLFLLVLSLSNGIQMIVIPIFIIILSFASFLGFAHKKKLELKRTLISLILGASMLSHLLFVSYAFVTDENMDKTLSKEMPSALEKKANEEPIEFIKSDAGRKLAFEVYELSPLTTTDESLRAAVIENPLPIKHAQQSLLVFGNTIAKNPYFAIMDYYFSNLLNTKKQ